MGLLERSRAEGLWPWVRLLLGALVVIMMGRRWLESMVDERRVLADEGTASRGLELRGAASSATA